MALPDDADKVLAAARLGWYVAEVRGRNRPDPPPAVEGHMPDRSGHALPLRSERTAPELRITAHDALTALAQDLTVDADPENGGASFGTTLAASSKDLSVKRAKHDPTASAAWDSFADLVYRFDAHIHDALTAASDRQACAYQLGRGLAETYWALDASAPVDPPGATTWSFLLGTGRCDELSRLLGRMAPYLNVYTPPAISGSLVVWNNVVRTDGWRNQPSAVDDLYAQTRRWYELILLGQDPTTLIKPFALIRNFRATLKAARLFWPQLLGGAVGVGALAWFAWLAAVGGGSSTGKAVLAVLGTVGVSLTTLQAKLKSSAQALVARLRADTYTDLVAIAITIVPARTDAERTSGPRVTSSTHRAVTSALRSRKLTTPVNVS
jgi:hypothetical protein